MRPLQLRIANKNLSAVYGLILTSSGQLSSGPLPLYTANQNFNFLTYDLWNVLGSYTNGDTVSDCSFTFNSLDSVGGVIQTMNLLAANAPSNPSSGRQAPEGSLSDGGFAALKGFYQTNKLIYGFSWTFSGFAISLPLVMTFYQFS